MNQQKIIDYITKNQQNTPSQIAQYLEISNEMTHRYLKKLVESGTLEKLGKPPKVFYQIKKPSEQLIETIENQEYAKIVDKNFTLITPDGRELEGVHGFVLWCKQRNFDVQKKAKEFYEIVQQYEQYENDGVIDATIKIDQTFDKEQRFLDHLYFLYPYSLPIFGKTKVATWLFHGKQTENTMLMKKVFDQVVAKLNQVISQGDYDAIGFIPPSVPRKIQFMKELQKQLSIKVPVIQIEKIKNAIIIQQKSLKDINDRIQNAENTLVITGKESYKKVLLIDDFTGSGSTLNTVAQKMKQQNIAEIVAGITITGSMNGFEVIKEI